VPGAATVRAVWAMACVIDAVVLGLISSSSMGWHLAFAEFFIRERRKLCGQTSARDR